MSAPARLIPMRDSSATFSSSIPPSISALLRLQLPHRKPGDRGGSEAFVEFKKEFDRVDFLVSNAALEALVERVGKIDVLVNNAGVIRDNLLPMLEDDDLKAVFETNIEGVFHFCRAVVPFMMSKRYGRIINISSVSAEKGGRGQTNYAASKGAINSFTKALAVEVGRRGIRVNAVAPGVIETEMSKDVRDLAGDEIISNIVLKRYGLPSEIANAVWFLSSDLANYITGQVLSVDGGFKM